MTAPERPLLTRDDLLALPFAPPDACYAYGPHVDQVADLYLPGPGTPTGAGPCPVALLLHGGCWRSAFDRTYLGQFARALGEHGIAAWNVEYRRIGAGGGWPQTFEDVARAADLLREAAQDRPLDLARVVVVGHSAGGHLGLWLAARQHLPEGAPGASARPLALRGVLALAAIPDLSSAYAAGVCGSSVRELLGAAPAEAHASVALASPAELPPTRIPHVHLVGEHDAIVPPDWLSTCVERMRGGGQDARFRVLSSVGHMEPVVAASSTWADVLATLQSLLNGTRS